MPSYTVFSGTLSGPTDRTTTDPALALGWARDRGPQAFVTESVRGVVWTPEQDRRCVGSLHDAVISAAVAQARR
jgi:hypothetical protein